MIDILALPQYTGASKEVLSNSLLGRFQTGKRIIAAENFHIFHGPDVNVPSVDKASWIVAGLRAAGEIPEIHGVSLSRIFREDLFHVAKDSKAS